MGLSVQPLSTTVEGAPGEVLEVVLAVVNDDEQPAVVLATPVGLGDATQLGLADQRFEIPARSRMLINVRAAVPATHGIGQHAEAIEVRQAGAVDARLVRYSLSIASVQKVTITPTPAPVRGRRSARFDLAIVNNEKHTVEFDLEAAGGDTTVEYDDRHFRLGPGQRALTMGRVKHRVQWFGESTIHHVQIVARGRAESSSAHLPFVQRPLIAGRLRSMVAAMAVVALWAGLAFVGIQWYRQRNDAPTDATEAETTLAPGSDGQLEVVDDTGGTGESGDSGGTDGTDGTGGSGGGSDAGSSSGDAGSSDAGGGSGDGGSGGSGTGGSTGDAGGAGGGDAAGDSGDAGTGGGSTGADDSPVAGDDAPDTASVDTSVVRGTVDVDGGSADVVITPTPMSLQDLADTPAEAFALAEQSPALKIWSARYVPPEPAATNVPSTTAIAAGPFAPDSDGIWGVSLPINQTYELSFRKPGFETESFVVTPVEGEQIDLDISLEPASATLSGVANGAGGRLENVEIIVTDGHFDYQTVTDENGAWGLTGVSSSPGYVVVGTLEGYGTDAVVVAVDPGADVGGVTLNLQSGRSVLAGSVVDASSGQPLGGATITAVSGATTSTTTTLTDGNVGTYQLPQLEAGARYAVTAELTGYRTATTSATVRSGLTTIAPLRLEPLVASITGTVSDSSTGAAISAASVTLTRDDLEQPVASVQTVNEGGDGMFTLGAVPPGQYLLTVEHWRHATARHVLVVDSASEVVLDPGSPSAQTGTNISIAMAPIDIGVIGDRPTGSVSLRIRDADESRQCPTLPDGSPRPAEQCSAIFNVIVELITTDQVFIDQADAGEGPFIKQTITTNDPVTGEPVTTIRYVLRCEPDTVCNSGDEFPDYTIRGVPVGVYTVRLSHPDYNTRTVQLTVRPDATTAETVNMARLGSVIGQVLDATGPTTRSILSEIPPVVIRRADIPGLVYPTRIVEDTFQTDDETLLPPGDYYLEVTGASAGYWIDPDQSVDPGSDAVGLAFTIPVPDPDNPTGRKILDPVYAEPYPIIRTRVLEPAGITPSITYGPISEPPTARLWCDSELGAAGAIDGTVSGSQITFGKVAVATLDAVTDGVLDTCTLETSAPGFETTQHVFGGVDAAGESIASLTPGDDRYVDVALIVESPGIVRQPAGTLTWTDAGQTPDPGLIPVPGATITPSGIITALIPADSTAEPGAGIYPITAHAPTIAAVTSELDGGVPPDAVWDFGPGVRQLIGEARFSIAAPGYPGGTLVVTIDENGTQTTTVEMDITNNTGAAGFAIDMEPSDGTLRGQVTIRTSDPAPDFSQVRVTTSMTGETAPTLDPGTDGAYSAGVAAGTWTTNVSTTAESNLQVVSAPTEDLSVCLPPGVTATGSPTTGTNSATFRQCVGPGASSPVAETTLVELGTLRLEAFDLTGARITDLTDFEIEIDSAATSPTVETATDTGADYQRLVVDGIAVPTIVDPPDYPGAAPATSHLIQLTNARNYDPSGVTRIDVTRFFNDGTTATTPYSVGSRNLELTGISLPFEAGAKYQIEVHLPSYGARSGDITTADSRGGSPAICTDPLASDGRAVVTAIPVRSTLVPVGVDPLGGTIYVSRWFRDTTTGPGGELLRDTLTTTTGCEATDGEFTLAGKSGDYLIAVDHPEFVSERSAAALAAALPTGVDVGAGDFAVEIPPSGDPTTPTAITNALPVLTIRGTPVDLRAYDALGGSAATGVYFVVRDAADVVLTTNPAPVNQTGIDITLDPAALYTIEFRGCTADPTTVAQFDGCDLRFPVTASIGVTRTTAPAPTITVEAPLVQVGAEITTTMEFVNSRDRPVCAAGTYTASRQYDGEFVGRVNGTDQTLAVDADLRDEELAFVVPTEAANATEQTNCIAAVAAGTFTQTFDEYIPTGTHTITVPLIAGYSTPTLAWDDDTGDSDDPVAISGTAVGTTHMAFDLNVTSITATTSAVVSYVATARAVTLDVCGQTDAGAIDCDEEFPGLLVNMVEPGGGATVAGSVQARTTSGTYEGSYPVLFASIIPDASPHSLVVADELHAGATPASVLVTPGADTLDFPTPFTFAGTSVKLAFRIQGLDTAAGTPVALPSATITVEGRTGNGGSWTTLPAGSACTISVDGAAQSFICFTNTDYKQFRATVEAPGYTPETTPAFDVKKGATEIRTITLIKRATLTVNATQYDASNTAVTTFTQSSLIELEAVTGGGTFTAVPSSTACASSAGCFQYLVDAGNYTDPDGGSVGNRTYRFKIGSTTAYLPAQTSDITATVGGTPTAATLALRPRILDVVVTAPGITITSVAVTFSGGTTITDTTGPYRFTSLDATPVPLDQGGTYLVTASDGRNVAGSFAASAGSVPVTVLPYLTVTGDVSSWVLVDTEVTATSGSTVRTTKVASDHTFTFSGTGDGGGLDVNADGSNRTWTIALITTGGTSDTYSVTASATSPQKVTFVLTVPTTVPPTTVPPSTVPPSTVPPTTAPPTTAPPTGTTPSG